MKIYQRLIIFKASLLLDFAFFLFIISNTINAQSKINYNNFDKQSLGQLQIILPQPPQPATFQQIDINNFSPKQAQVNSPAQPNLILDYNNSTERQNQQILQQTNMLPGQPTNAQQVQQMADIERDLMETKFYRDEMEWLARSQSYRQAFNELSKLNPDSFSITKAVFIIENAYYNNQFSYATLIKGLAQRALLVKQILKHEGLSSNNNLALNYGIQKLYSQQNLFYSSKLKQNILVPKIGYDFDDFMGKKDWSKMFVLKLLATGKGQCHSMPLLYLMIAEQLGAKAYLSLAPQHSFIKFADKNGTLLNFETTNGNLVSNSWLVQSGYITAQALQNKMYLDTLSERNLYAQMLSDLLLGYLDKFPYDDFAEQIRKKILQINSDNTTALIVDANVKTQIALQKINAVGKPKPEELHNYPDAYKAYQDMQTAYDKLNNSGYQDMPAEAYQRWLRSIEQEKKKQANRELKEQMQREMQQLKNMKMTLKNNKKD